MCQLSPSTLSRLNILEQALMLPAHTLLFLLLVCRSLAERFLPLYVADQLTRSCLDFRWNIISPGEQSLLAPISVLCLVLCSGCSWKTVILFCPFVLTHNYWFNVCPPHYIISSIWVGVPLINTVLQSLAHVRCSTWQTWWVNLILYEIFFFHVTCNSNG